MVESEHCFSFLGWKQKEMSYIMLIVALPILLFFASWLAEIKFMKLEVRPQHV